MTALHISPYDFKMFKKIKKWNGLQKRKEKKRKRKEKKKAITKKAKTMVLDNGLKKKRKERPFQMV